KAFRAAQIPEAFGERFQRGKLFWRQIYSPGDKHRVVLRDLDEGVENFGLGWTKDFNLALFVFRLVSWHVVPRVCCGSTRETIIRWLAQCIGECLNRILSDFP